MLSMTELYRTWRRRVAHIIPDYVTHRCYREPNLFWLLVGIYQAAHIYLSKVALKIPIRVRKLSLTRRFRRFLDNDAIDVRAWYRPTMQRLIDSAHHSGQIRLIIDCTTVGRKHLLMMVAVAYRRRALPIAWSWIPIPNGNGRSTEKAQIRLLNYIRAHLPENAFVSLVGDTEFGGSQLIKALKRWGWLYTLHQKENTAFFYKGIQTFQDIPIAPGQQVWIPQVHLFQSYWIPSCSILIHHEQGYENPLYLTTNFADADTALQAYQRRMWIEEMFGDFKRHGFHLWHSRLETSERLSRLTLLVCFLYLWLISLGQYVIDTDRAGEVDRTDRRDLSLFRLGWDWLERRRTFGDPIPPVFVTNLTFSTVDMEDK